MFGWFATKTIEEYDPHIPRDELIRRGRILIIDDEKPVLLEALQKNGFCVDYDPTGCDTGKIEHGMYDVILLDYHGVGHEFGKDQGLDLLRHIKRTTPGTRVIAFTSKALTTDQSDFYRLSDESLQKDAGLAESLKIIESSLQESLRLRNLWHAILTLSGIRPKSDKADELEKALLKAIKKHDIKILKEALMKACGKVAEKTPEVALKKLCNAVGIPWI